MQAVCIHGCWTWQWLIYLQVTGYSGDILGYSTDPGTTKEGNTSSRIDQDTAKEDQGFFNRK